MASPPQAGKIHYLKCYSGPFDAVRIGRKTFEVRRNDRGFLVGDVLMLREWNPSTEEYTGQILDVKVKYLVQGEWGLPGDLCVMGIEIKHAQPRGEECDEGGG